MEGHHLHEAPRKGEEENKMKKREERRMESTYFSKKLSCSMKGSQGSSTQAYKQNHMTHKVLIKSQPMSAYATGNSLCLKTTQNATKDIISKLMQLCVKTNEHGNKVCTS